MTSNNLPAPQPIIALQINSQETPNKLSESQWSLIERLGLACSSHGKPICNLTNVIRVLESMDEYKKIAWFDEFHKRCFTTWRTGIKREWTDIDDLRLTVDLQASIGLHNVSDEIVAKAIRVYAHRNIENEPKDWLDTLTWDGTKRISDFLTVCMGAENSEYIRSASRNFWIGMVARVYRPGCQLDNMIVLEGAQGIGKTRALRLIGGDWYTSAKESVQRNDFFMVLHGKLIVEIAELDSFSRAEVTRIKQVVSDPMDRYRMPYDRRPQDHYRMSIFVGTTNEEDYLRDTTGARRFWPIRCNEIDMGKISEIRTQLFAEAVFNFRRGEQWFHMPEAATKEEQENRRQIDPWEEIIGKFLNNPLKESEGVSITEIANECLRIEPSKLNRITQMRIADVLKLLNWQNRRIRKSGKAPSMIWLPKEILTERYGTL